MKVIDIPRKKLQALSNKTLADLLETDRLNCLIAEYAKRTGRNVASGFCFSEATIDRTLAIQDERSRLLRTAIFRGRC